MQSALVLGTARATVKHQSLVGQKLLIVQPLQLDGRPDGPPLLSLDALGAGKGDTAVITSDGRYTRELLGEESKAPARWSAMGIVDDC